MTTCRDTPPFRSTSNDTCLGQILSGFTLAKCLTAPVPSAPFFLRQLHDNLWITSSPKSLHCIKIPKTEFDPSSYQTSNLNEKLILPPVALVNVTPGLTIACHDFLLTGHPVESSIPSIVILYYNTVSRNNNTILDIY
ncbi:unnamed protein product [Adineta steineri]|uniref:Uncharacterized protein n=1 Tax=Adineta steineri TaxID=433720 RepID=A0A815SUW8_9BILA|nr:unnamed protein product [Adineta steineri]CAF1643754.1 unnamed protein product [Adineta steineri]